MKSKMYREIMLPSGIVVKVGRVEEHNVIDIRAREARDGETLIFMAVSVTPGSWLRLKHIFSVAERLMVESGWLERPGKSGSLFHLVKSE